MTAQEYLERLDKINTLINNKKIEYKQWFDVATDTTAKLTADRVKSTGNPQRGEAAIINYVDTKTRVLAEIAELEAKRDEIIKTLEQLPEAEYDVLHMIFVQHKTLQEAAYKRDISYSYVAKIKDRALDRLAKYIKKCKKL